MGGPFFLDPVWIPTVRCTTAPQKDRHGESWMVLVSAIWRHVRSQPNQSYQQKASKSSVSLTVLTHRFFFHLVWPLLSVRSCSFWGWSFDGPRYLSSMKDATSHRFSCIFWRFQDTTKLPDDLQRTGRPIFSGGSRQTQHADGKTEVGEVASPCGSAIPMFGGC